MVTCNRPLAHPALYLPDSFTVRRYPDPAHGCTYMHFGENQLSPGSISISPLSTRHPPVLQHWWVRASTRSYPRFTLRMDSSPGFGSGDGNSLFSVYALFRLAFAPAPRLYRRLTCPPRGRSPQCRCRHQLVGSFYKRHAVRLPPAEKLGAQARPPTACRRWVSESLSSPSRGAFHLSLTVLVPYRWPGST